MRAIIEIELEMDGEYRKTDNQSIIDAILTSMESVWIIDDERLTVRTNVIACNLKGRP